MDEQAFAGATIDSLGRSLRARETTAVELAEIALARLDRIGRSLNAVVTLTPELALEQARQAEVELAAGIDRGPLHGIPYGAKDLLATDDIPTTWGAEPFRDQQLGLDAAVIELLRDAGAVLVAKLAMVELAGGFGYEQPNASLTGPGRCSWDRDAWTGGSSSGSGSAVGAGCVPFAIGTETWGSIHCPSAFNGITGLRPSFGRVSRRGAMALSWTMDKIGPMARSVMDCRMVYDALIGPDEADPATLRTAPGDPAASGRPWRFGVFREAVDAAQPEIGDAFDDVLRVLGDFGELTEITLPGIPWDEVASLVIMAEAASAFEEFIESGGSMELTAPEDRSGLLHGLAVPAVDYLRAMRVRRVGMRQMDELLAQFDALIAPTYLFVAPPIDQPFSAYSERAERHTLGAAGNLCGLPSVSVPCGFGERHLPIGLEFMGRAWNESSILSAAEAFQSRTGWHQERPATSRG